MLFHLTTKVVRDQQCHCWKSRAGLDFWAHHTVPDSCGEDRKLLVTITASVSCARTPWSLLHKDWRRSFHTPLLCAGAAAASRGVLSEHVQLLRNRSREQLGGQAAIVWFWHGPRGGWEHALPGSRRRPFLASRWIICQGTAVMKDAGSSALKGPFQTTSCWFLLSGREAIPLWEDPNKGS